MICLHGNTDKCEKCDQLIELFGKARLPNITMLTEFGPIRGYSIEGVCAEYQRRKAEKDEE